MVMFAVRLMPAYHDEREVLPIRHLFRRCSTQEDHPCEVLSDQRDNGFFRPVPSTLFQQRCGHILTNELTHPRSTVNVSILDSHIKAHFFGNELPVVFFDFRCSSKLVRFAI